MYQLQVALLVHHGKFHIFLQVQITNYSALPMCNNNVQQQGLLIQFRACYHASSSTLKALIRNHRSPKGSSLIRFSCNSFKIPINGLVTCPSSYPTPTRTLEALTNRGPAARYDMEEGAGEVIAPCLLLSLEKLEWEDSYTPQSNR